MQHPAMVMRLAMVMHPITPLLQPHTPLGTGVIHTSNITHMCLIAQPHGDRYSSKQPRSTNHTSSGAGRIARSKRETSHIGGTLDAAAAGSGSTTRWRGWALH